MEKEQPKNQIQYFYETTLNKIVEETVTEKRQENGAEISVSKPVKKMLSVKLAFIKPTRRVLKESEIFYAKRLSAYLKEGLIPQSLISKRYMDDGGPLSEDAKKVIAALKERQAKNQLEYFNLNGKDQETEKKKAELMLSLAETSRLIREVEDSYVGLYENTAEAKAKNDTIEWWMLNLTQIEEDNKYVPFFVGKNHEERLENLESIQEKNDPFFNEVIKKSAYYISFWDAAGNLAAKEDYDAAEKHYNEHVSDYHVEDPNKPKEEVKAS